MSARACGGSPPCQGWALFCGDFAGAWRLAARAAAKRQFEAAQAAAEELRAKTRTRKVTAASASALKKRFSFRDAGATAKAAPSQPPEASRLLSSVCEQPASAANR